MRDDDVAPASGRSPRTGPLAGYFRLIEVFAGTSMALILVVMVVQVAARYLFASSLIWAEEFCRYVLIWQTFLLLGVAFRRGEFVALDIVPGLLPPGLRLALKAVMAVPILIFLGLMVYYGWDYAARVQRQTIPALDFIWSSLTGAHLAVSIRWVYIAVPVGSGLLALHVIADLVESWLRLRAPRNTTKSATGST
jgi:TRAP-type C4-dicarboxylate transport system permease small subunit